MTQLYHDFFRSLPGSSSICLDGYAIVDHGLAHHNCQQCNYWKGGNYSEFQIRLIKEIGLDEYNALHKLAKSGEKLSTTDYLELRKWYKDKYESLT